MENESGVPLEVHLIDTPGFDDDFDADADILHKVAAWINAVFHNENERISGVLLPPRYHTWSNSGFRSTKPRNAP